jgi:hypothetical protein
MTRTKTYDPECLVLAKHFLPDGCPEVLNGANPEELALAIQTAVEDWFFMWAQV